MDENRKALEQFLNCDGEYFEKGREGAALARFRELQAQGREECLWPLMIGVSDTLCEALLDFPQDGTPEDRLVADTAKATQLQGKEVLDRRREQAMAYSTEAQILGDAPNPEAAGTQLGCSLNLNDGGTLIAKLPCQNPWELALRIPMGGFNECPNPPEQAAVFRYWYEKYGAVPAVVTYDVWEMEVARPPQTHEEALELAWEQFFFCEDIVLQGVETVSTLAATLKNSPAWYFWWD